jgi:hypothetical protein
LPFCNGVMCVRDLDVAEGHEDDCASNTYADLMMQGRRGSDDIFGRRRSSSKIFHSPQNAKKCAPNFCLCSF